MERTGKMCNYVAALFFLIACAGNLEAATLSAGSGSGEPGDSGIEIPVSLTSSGGEDVCGFVFNLSFDTDRLTYQSVAKGPMAIEASKSLTSSRPSDDVVRILVIGINQNVIGNGVVVTVTFAIREDAPGGNATLTLSSMEITDCSGDLVSASSQGGEIVVEGGAVTTTSTSTTVTTTIGDCQIDDDCNDGLYCTGEERCGDGVCNSSDPPCPDDGLYCTGAETCDEENDTCQEGGNPCLEPTPVCDEVNDVCLPDSQPSIVIDPALMYQSRWFPLLVLVKVIGFDTGFTKSSEVSIAPAGTLAAWPFVNDEKTIVLMGILMPSLIAPHSEIEVRVVTDAEEVFGTADLKLLPFVLEEGKQRERICK